jgi:hypothetical protein
LNFEELVKWFGCLEIVVGERQDLIVDSLRDFEPVKRFKNRSYVMKFRSLGYGTG